MQNVILELDKRTNTMLAFVTEDSGEVTEVPLLTVRGTPMTKIPVIVEDVSERIPQELLDTLMRVYWRGQPEEWWQGYYIERLKDAVKYAAQIKAADASFRVNPDLRFLT